MTDVSENVLGKKVDLKTYFKLAQDAFEAKDLSQAKQISENGLKQAQLENNGEWTQKFDLFNNELAQFYADRISEGDMRFAKQKVISRPEIVSVKEDLTIVNGIGKTVAEKLCQAGITSVRELALASKEQLMRIKGIGSETATRFIDSAKSSIKVPTLNTFTSSNPKIIPPRQENTIKRNDRNVVSSNKDKKWFEDKFKKLKFGVWYSQQGQEIQKSKTLSSLPQVSPLTEDDDESYEIEELPEYDQIPEETVLEKSNNQKESLIENQRQVSSATIEKPPHIEIRPHDDIIEKRKVSTLNSQKVTSVELNDVKAAVQEELTSSGYYLIHHNTFLDNIFQGIDLLGVKLIQVNEFLDLLLLIPIKIN